MVKSVLDMRFQPLVKLFGHLSTGLVEDVLVFRVHSGQNFGPTFLKLDLEGAGRFVPCVIELA